jgi:hypothetical protein
VPKIRRGLRTIRSTAGTQKALRRSGIVKQSTSPFGELHNKEVSEHGPILDNDRGAFYLQLLLLEVSEQAGHGCSRCSDHLCDLVVGKGQRNAELALHSIFMRREIQQETRQLFAYRRIVRQSQNILERNLQRKEPPPGVFNAIIQYA